MATSERVNNPDHYRAASNSLQVIDIIEMFDLNFHRGNAVKYVLRAGKKEEVGYETYLKEIEDLKKAIWYLNREIGRTEAKAQMVKLSEIEIDDTSDAGDTMGAGYERS